MKIARQLWLYIRNPDCCYCERRMAPPDRAKGPLSATVEHIVPAALGGTDGGLNVTLACRDCNELKGDLTFDEFVAAVAFMVLSERKLIRTSGGHLKPLRNMPGVVIEERAA